MATRKTEEEWGGACALTKLIFCFLRGGKKKKDNGKLRKRKERAGEGNLAVRFLLLKIHDGLLEWKEKNTNKKTGNY